MTSRVRMKLLLRYHRSYEERDILIDIVRRTAEEIFIPLTVGGVRVWRIFGNCLRLGG